MFALGQISEQELRRKASRTSKPDDSPDIARRSLLAFLKATKEVGETPSTTLIEYGGKLYSAVVQREQIGAVYRVRNDLQLKRMRRIPEPVAFAAEQFRRDSLGEQK